MGWLRTMRANPGPLGSASVRRRRSMGNHWMASSVEACSAVMLSVSMPVAADVGEWANAVRCSMGDSGSDMQERCGCLRSHTFSAVCHGCLAHKTTTKCCVWLCGLQLVAACLDQSHSSMASILSLFRAGQPASGAGVGRLFVEVMNGDKMNAKSEAGRWPVMLGRGVDVKVVRVICQLGYSHDDDNGCCLVQDIRRKAD